MSKNWDEWFQALPKNLGDQESYTATLLYTLHRVLESAPFEWGLTGGTAVQSFLPESKRRYSSDVEAITRAREEEVQRWMKSQGWKPEAVVPRRILKAELTPEGTLFVIHSYDSQGYQAAAPKPQPFQHFPLPGNAPPGPLQVPLLDLDFLVATKLYEAWRADRGGERRKDIHDLGLVLPLATPERVLQKLGIYLTVRGANAVSEEVLQRAGAWIRFALEHLEWFENWRNTIVRDATQFDTRKDLARAASWIEKAIGKPVTLAAWEHIRFLLHDATPRQLKPIGDALGCTDDPSRMRFADCVASKAAPLLQGPLPTDLPSLLDTLGKVSRKKPSVGHG